MAEFWGVLPVVLGMVGIIIAGFATYKGKATESTVKALEVGNTEVRTQNKELRALLEENEIRCQKETTQLKTRLELLEGDFVEKIVKAVIEGFQKHTG